MVDNFLLIGIATACITIAGIIVTNFWNNRIHKNVQEEQRQSLIDKVEETAKQKWKEEKTLAQELLQNNEKVVKSLKEDLRDYIDKGDNDVKKELAYAVKLIEKDIVFIQQFIFGKESKSTPAYLKGEEETKEHDAEEGHGMFKDTEQEAEDRKSDSSEINKGENK